VALGLEIDPSIPVTSPTFTLVGEYPGRTPLRHADFYRVDGYDRLLDAGFDDLLDGRGVLVVEWPERLPAALPDERLEIRIEPAGESARRLFIGGQGARAGRIREEFLKT
jgi:tRNA threonylcarbamoyladenosine biosynthesis protein TsaE